jgi:hypothetical protein
MQICGMSKFSEVTAPCFVSGHDFSRAKIKAQKDLGFSPCAFFHSGVPTWRKKTSHCSELAPDKHFVQDALLQGLKPAFNRRDKFAFSRRMKASF